MPWCICKKKYLIPIFSSESCFSISDIIVFVRYQNGFNCMFEVCSLVAHILCRGLIYKITKIVDSSLGVQFESCMLFSQIKISSSKSLFTNVRLLFMAVFSNLDYGPRLITYIWLWLWTSFDNFYLIVQAVFEKSNLLSLFFFWFYWFACQ